MTSATLGLALLAGAVTTGILLIAGVFTLANLPIVFGVMLAVLGLGPAGRLARCAPVAG